MNSEHKNYPLKEIRTIFSISSISVIRSAFVKQGHFSILAVYQNVLDLHKFVFADLNSERKNYPMKEFRAIFPISSISVKSTYAKQGQFSILAIFQNEWDVHKFGVAYLNSERKIYPMKEFRAIFFNFIDFRHQVCETRSSFIISCIPKYMGFT